MSSWQLLEHGLECDRLETFERGRAAFDLHAQHRALPGCEQEIGKLVGIEVGRDLALRLRLSDAGRERRAPFPENLIELLAQHLARARCLEAEIADQAAAGEAVMRKLAG